MSQPSIDKTVYIKPVAIASCAALAVSLIILAICAAVLVNFDADPSLILTLSIAAQGLGSFAGALIGAKIMKHSGLIIGAVTGAVLFMIFTLAGMITGAAVSIISLIRLAVLIISGALGGVVGVNVHREPTI